MGFRDELRRQALDARARQDSGAQLQRRTVLLVEAAARELRQSLLELSSHLQVLQPAAPVRYRLDRQVVLDGLPRQDFRFDSRRASVLDEDVLSHMHLSCSVRSGRAVQLGKDFVNEMEQLEARLAQAGIAYDREPVREAESGRLLQMRYAFVADVELGLHVQCDHAQGLLRLRLHNLDGLETIRCVLPPADVDNARLDELARWWAGAPHRFLDGLPDLQRTEAR
ncbi:MAG: hypothetical protein ABI696_07800 [Rubrivivax sp.]